MQSDREIEEKIEKSGLEALYAEFNEAFRKSEEMHQVRSFWTDLIKKEFGKEPKITIKERIIL